MLCLIIVVLLMQTVRDIFGRATGEWYAIIIPLFVTSFGFVSRMVEQSLSEVNGGVIEAAKAMGTPTLKIITRGTSILPSRMKNQPLRR